MTRPAASVVDTTADELHRLLVDHQVRGRLPGVRAGVVRGGSLVWSDGVGRADLDVPGSAPDDATQFEIASITKTFTAAVVLALRDEGRLSLDDPVERHVPESRHTGITLRSMLAHLSGVQREAEGTWRSLVFPTGDRLVDAWNAAAVVHRPHHQWHYSNLCYAVLGEIVRRVDDRPWFDSVRARVLEPLGMDRTTLGRTLPGAAAGYFVPPDADVPMPEPTVDFAGFTPVGGLASTVADLARWAAFWADPVAEVLDPASVEEMVRPQAMLDLESWRAGYGLGLYLLRDGDDVFVGHIGGNPGFSGGLFVHRGTGTGAVILANATSGAAHAALAIALARTVMEREPAPPVPWQPGESVPAELSDLLGAWWFEGDEIRFRVVGGRLQARSSGSPPDVPPSTFEVVAEDVFRTVSGRDAGELLRVVRDVHGEVVELTWSSYPYIRVPGTFGPR